MKDNIADKVSKSVRSLGREWVSIRRDIHKYPELGWCEFRTTDFIAQKIESLGIDYLIGESIHEGHKRMGLPEASKIKEAAKEAIGYGVDPSRVLKMGVGFTGLCCTIAGDKQGGCKALRIEIDALPINEACTNSHSPFQKGFASSIIGRMHACGHDAHAAIGIGVAQVLSSLKQHLRGIVKIIFQPAEEGVRGAYSMVEKGLADDVDELIGFHVGVKATDYGELITGWQGLLSTPKINIEVFGKRAHAAIAPHKGNNAIIAASQIATRLDLISKNIGHNGSINIGRIRGGEARNIVPHHTLLEIETRSLDELSHSELILIIKKELNSLANELKIDYKLSIVGEAYAYDSDESLAERIMGIAELHSSFKNIQSIKNGYSASDDASLWFNRVRSNGGLTAFLGIGTPVGTGHHTASFDIDERVIPHTVELLSNYFLLENF